MHGSEDMTDSKKAKRKGLALKIGVWVNLFAAFLGIPLPFLGAGAFLGSCLELVGLVKDRHLASKPWYYAMSLFAMTLGFLTASPWRDAAPIDDDYTLADLLSADPTYNHTYDLLISSFFSKHSDSDGTPSIGLDREEIDFLHTLHQSRPSDLSGRIEWRNQHREELYRLWNKAEKARGIVHRFAEFEQIADLSEPGLSETSMSTVDCRSLAELYCNVVPLMVQDGRIQEGLSGLIEWNTFTRKLSVTARTMTTKLMCYGILLSCLDTANEINNHSNATRQTIEILKEQFPALTPEQISLRNPLLFEYLSAIKQYSVFRYLFFFKHMSSVRLLRNYTDKILTQENGPAKTVPTYTVWPFWLSFMPDVGTDIEVLPWYYRYYNPGGPIIAGIFLTPVERLPDFITHLQINDDLFQCVLSYRLEERADLSARAFGDTYVVDIEKKRIYSQGPDGNALTNDDIWLPIEPDVLGLVE